MSQTFSLSLSLVVLLFFALFINVLAECDNHKAEHRCVKQNGVWSEKECKCLAQSDRCASKQGHCYPTLKDCYEQEYFRCEKVLGNCGYCGTTPFQNISLLLEQGMSGNQTAVGLLLGGILPKDPAQFDLWIMQLMKRELRTLSRYYYHPNKKAQFTYENILKWVKGFAPSCPASYTAECPFGNKWDSKHCTCMLFNCTYDQVQQCSSKYDVKSEWSSMINLYTCYCESNEPVPLPIICDPKVRSSCIGVFNMTNCKCTFESCTTLDQKCDDGYYWDVTACSCARSTCTAEQKESCRLTKIGVLNPKTCDCAPDREVMPQLCPPGADAGCKGTFNSRTCSCQCDSSKAKFCAYNGGWFNESNCDCRSAFCNPKFAAGCAVGEVWVNRDCACKPCANPAAEVCAASGGTFNFTFCECDRVKSQSSSTVGSDFLEIIKSLQSESESSDASNGVGSGSTGQGEVVGESGTVSDETDLPTKSLSETDLPAKSLSEQKQQALGLSDTTQSQNANANANSGASGADARGGATGDSSSSAVAKDDSSASRQSNSDSLQASSGSSGSSSDSQSQSSGLAWWFWLVIVAVALIVVGVIVAAVIVMRRRRIRRAASKKYKKEEQEDNHYVRF